MPAYPDTATAGDTPAPEAVLAGAVNTATCDPHVTDSAWACVTHEDSSSGYPTAEAARTAADVHLMEHAVYVGQARRPPGWSRSAVACRRRRWRPCSPAADRPLTRDTRNGRTMTVDLADAAVRADLEAAGYTLGRDPIGWMIEDGPTCGGCSQIIIPGEDHTECGAHDAGEAET